MTRGRQHTRMLPYGFVKHVVSLCYCSLCGGPNEGRKEERKRARRNAKKQIQQELNDAEI